ncbi:MAG TPA: alpha/beta hydrolase [Anaeromyxobacteraceae bacterium]|nr:alpha/beta hydrolase [Anaeromyxobacteraceae bacterium]
MKGALLCALAMSASSVLDHPLISERYFFPRKDRVASPFLVEVDGATLACAFRKVAADAPTVVHFHGNGEVVGDWDDGFVRWLGSLGWSVLLAEYRGYGMSTGSPQLGRMLDDVERVVKASGVPPERIVFFGRSVGSLFALEAVSRFPRAAGLVIESGIADVQQRLALRVDASELGVPRSTFEAAIRERLDQRAKIAGYRGPVLILHTRDDGLVDVSHARDLASAAGGPVTLRIFERGDHNSILTVNEAEYRAAVAEFLKKVAPR